MENCSFEGIDAFVYSLHLAVYIPIFIVGITLNALALIVFCRVLKKWMESTIYMTNLALMDLLLLLILPFRIYTGTMQKTFCTFLETLYFICMYGSIFTIVCICVDRYIAIKHPFHATTLRSPKKAFGACAVIWVSVWLGSIPVYDFHNSYGNISCFHNFSNTMWNPPVIIAVELFGFIIPMVLLVVCSVEIIKTLQKKNSHRDNMSSKACVRIIYANLLVFLVSFMPSHLGIFLQCLTCNSKLPASGPHEDCVACLGPEHSASALADKTYCQLCARFKLHTLCHRAKKAVVSHSPSSQASHSEFALPSGSATPPLKLPLSRSPSSQLNTSRRSPDTRHARERFPSPSSQPWVYSPSSRECPRYHSPLKHGTIPSDYREPLRSFVQVSLCLTNVNCMLDGICYYLILKENWKSTREVTEATESSSLKAPIRSLRVAHLVKARQRGVHGESLSQESTILHPGYAKPLVFTGDSGGSF
ncbi:GPR55 protein, partial [Polyodon spathula]|nr:GPR55 protein [Polyodon spathula]